MARFLLVGCVGMVLPLCGCVTQDSATPLVPGNPLGAPPVVQAPARVSYSAASDQAATRVGTAGQKLIMANPQLGVRPVFRTVGAPQAEVFHRGTSEIVVTEGLVKQCPTEGQLAAVLAVELGKMISERETLAGPPAKQPEREPPIDLRVGTDNTGSYGAADQVRLAELAKYEKERRRPNGATATPPDPRVLARSYLTRAGYAGGELEAAASVLSAAEASCALEKQMTAQVPSRPWQPQ